MEPNEVSNCTCDFNVTSCNTTACTSSINNRTSPPFTSEVLAQETVIILHTLYIIILFVGLFGNFLTCAVITLRKSMRRSIHFYTFNLALCDLFILFFYVPTQMVYLEKQLTWTMGLEMCKVSYVVLPIALVGSIGTLLAITADRARGLLQPFKYRSDSKRNAKLIIPVIWLVALVTSIPLFIVPSLETFNGVIICMEKWPNTLYERSYWVTIFIVAYAIPLTVIFVIHIAMIIVMMMNKNTKQRQQNKRMIKMTIAVVTLFSICTGLQHVHYLLGTFSTQFKNISIQEQALLYSVSNFVVSLQAALNPIMYGTLRQDFNKAFKNIFKKLMSMLTNYETMKYSVSSGITPLTPVVLTTANERNGLCIKEHMDQMRINNSSPQPSDSPLLPKRLTVFERVTEHFFSISADLTSPSYDPIIETLEQKMFFKKCTEFRQSTSLLAESSQSQSFRAEFNQSQRVVVPGINHKLSVENPDYRSSNLEYMKCDIDCSNLQYLLLSHESFDDMKESTL